VKQIWTAQARRIDALSLRERAIMFVSIVLALAALADMFLVSPALAERRALVTQMRQQTQQLEALRKQLTALDPRSPDDTPQGRQRAAIAAARSQQTQLDAQIREQLAGREEIARLPDVLDRVLRRHERLTLTRLATAADAPAGAAAAAPPEVRWQGADLSVAGSYPDLLQYLADLEHALPGLRWGALQITTPSTQPVLTVRLMLAGEVAA
jgi:MSHA biogenesis protein MshJ